MQIPAENSASDAATANNPITKDAADALSDEVSSLSLEGKNIVAQTLELYSDWENRNPFVY